MDGHATGSPPDHAHPLEASDPPMVGGYPLIGRIGAGGMGTVYLGHEPGSDARVAVKTIHPHLAADAAYRRRFDDEAVLAGRVASFCTARVLAHGEEDGLPYIVSEYVGGLSLQHRISANGPLPAADVHGVAVGVMSALAAIHSAGLVHRDLKPANVMLTLSGCRVIDFGIARAQDAAGTLTGSGTVLGTPGWMAPEVLTGGAAGPAADIFAWGCLIAYAGTGRLPFGDGQPIAVARRVIRDEPDLAGLPGTLLPAVRAALSKDPERRPSAARLLLALVEQGGQGGLGEIPAVPAPRPASRSGVRSGARKKAAAPVPEPRRAPGGDGPDTAAFTVITHVGARSTTRVRLLAAAGAAAATLLVGGLIAGMGGDEGGAAPVRQTTTTAPVDPAASPSPTRTPVRRAVPVRKKKPKLRPKTGTTSKQKAKGNGKKKARGR
ncbi:serine/threonine-protein kinase [Spirillospora sp. NPDC029432]|uniref:serine/threonine-protein kinase n=1 Tax=Spirillospora sp. NPDC029432 TaxID=3154599 RepID=UPI003453D2E3